MGQRQQEPDFGAFYVKYSPLVRRVLTRKGVRAEDLDDAVQEAFITIRRLLPEFEGRSTVETWLHSVSWRVAANHRRAQSRHEVAHPYENGEVAADVGGEPAQRLHARLGAIEDEQRDLWALHDVGGFSISDVSKITGRARATVRERLERTRAALSSRLGARGVDGVDEDWIDRLAPGLGGRIAARPAPGPKLLTHGGSVFAAWDDVVIAVWRGETSAEALERELLVAFGVLDAYPQGIRILTIVEPSSQVPSREVRQLQSWAVRKLKIRAAAWSIEDRRMISLVAPVMNACMFVAGTALNVRFFDGLAPAAAWVASYGDAPDAHQLAQHARFLRSLRAADVPDR